MSKLLDAENQRRLEYARTAASRHSRFGTTITVTLNQAKLRKKEDEAESAQAGPSSQTIVSHRQAAINRDSGTILDMKKKNKAKKMNKVEELGLEDNLSQDAKIALRDLARTFLEACFNSEAFSNKIMIVLELDLHPSFPCLTSERYQVGEA